MLLINGRLVKKQESENLAKSIRNMSRQGLLFKTLKKELSLLGYWKNKPRGDSTAGRLKLKEINALRKQNTSINSHQIYDEPDIWS